MRREMGGEKIGSQRSGTCNASFVGSIWKTGTFKSEAACLEYFRNNVFENVDKYLKLVLDISIHVTKAFNQMRLFL